MRVRQTTGKAMAQDFERVWNQGAYKQLRHVRMFFLVFVAVMATVAALLQGGTAGWQREWAQQAQWPPGVLRRC